MLDPTVLIVLVVVLALIFDFTNGWNDSANAIATVIGTRALTPFKALMLAATLNLAGAFFSTAVANTIAKGIVNPEYVTQLVIVATLVAAIIWNVVMTLMGLPISASHGLIGALVGAAVAFKGFAALQWSGIMMILVALLVSPILGAILSWLMMKLIRELFRNTAPSKVKRLFRPLQILSASFMSFSHGTSDAQKAMGIITLALITGGFIPDNRRGSLVGDRLRWPGDGSGNSPRRMECDQDPGYAPQPSEHRPGICSGDCSGGPVGDNFQDWYSSQHHSYAHRLDHRRGGCRTGEIGSVGCSWKNCVCLGFHPSRNGCDELVDLSGVEHFRIERMFLDNLLSRPLVRNRRPSRWEGLHLVRTTGCEHGSLFFVATLLSCIAKEVSQ